MSLVFRLLFVCVVANSLKPPIWTLMENVFDDSRRGMYVIINCIYYKV